MKGVQSDSGELGWQSFGVVTCEDLRIRA